MRHRQRRRRRSLPDPKVARKSDDGGVVLCERTGAARTLRPLDVSDGFDQFPNAADKALLGTQIDAHEQGIDAECPRAAAGVGIEAPDYGLVVLMDGRVGVAPAT